MENDKLTTKFNESVGTARLLAIENGNQFLDPVHILLSMLNGENRPIKKILEKAGVNVNSLRKLLHQKL